jgi:hypothetical protein
MLAGATNSLLSNPYLMSTMSGGGFSNPFSVGGMFSPYQTSTIGPSGLSQSQLLAAQNAGF